MDDACTTRPPWQHTVATTRRRVVARRWRRETLLATRLTHARPRRLLHPLLALPAVFLLLLASPRALVRSRVVLSGDANLRLPATAAARGAASGAGSADAAAWPSTREGAPPGKPFSSASTAGSDSDSALESGSAASRRVASHAQWAAAIAESLTRREREDGDGETGGEDEDEGRTPRAGLKREAVAGRAAPIVLPLQRQVRRAHSRERKTGGGGRAGAGEAPREGGGGEAGTRRRQLRGLPLDLRGSVLELGYYYVTLYLGWPPQRFALIRAAASPTCPVLPARTAVTTRCDAATTNWRRGDCVGTGGRAALVGAQHWWHCKLVLEPIHRPSVPNLPLCSYPPSPTLTFPLPLSSLAPRSPNLSFLALPTSHRPRPNQDPRFNPALSASYATIPCAHHRCLTHACSPAGLCTYHGVYAEASSTRGLLASDLLSFAPPPLSPSAPHPAAAQPHVPAGGVQEAHSPLQPTLPAAAAVPLNASQASSSLAAAAAGRAGERVLLAGAEEAGAGGEEGGAEGEGGGGEGEGVTRTAERAAPDGPRLVFGCPSVPSPIPPPRVCELQETGDLYLQRADGIVGLGRDALSLPNQLLLAGVMREDVFSLCFAAPADPHAADGVEHGAYLGAADEVDGSSIGGHTLVSVRVEGGLAGTAQHGQGGGEGEGGGEGGVVDVEGEGGELILGRAEELPGTVWTPLLPSASETPYYIVSVEEMVVGQERVAVAAAVWEEGPYGGVMLDSGTTFSYLPSPAFHAFAALVRAAVPLPQVPGPDTRYSDVCFANVSSVGGMNRLFPAATIVFGNGAALHLRPHNYLFKHKKHEDAVCLGVFDNGTGGALIGAPKPHHSQAEEHEEEGEEESEGSEGGRGGSSNGDGGTDGALAAAQQHLLTPAGQWSSCTHTPMSIVKEASRKYTTIRWRCTGRGGQRVLWDAEEAVGSAVTAVGDSEADRGMAHGRVEGVGAAGADGDGGEQAGVAASGAGVEGGEQRDAAEWSGGSEGQHSQSHSHTHLLLHLVFSARHPPLLLSPPPSTSAPSASAAPLSLPPSVSTTPPLPTVLPALLPAVATALLVRPSRMALAAFSSSTLLLPSAPRTEGEDAHDRGSTGDAHDSQQQRQRHFTTASLTLDCPSPRSHRTAPPRTCSHEAQRLARLVRAGRCQGVGERVQRAMRGEGTVEKLGSGDLPVLLRCSLHTLLPAAATAAASAAAAASTRSPPDHGGTPALSDSPLTTSSHAAAAQPHAASAASGSSKAKEGGGLPHEQWQAEYGHEESRGGGAAAGVRGAGEGQMGGVGKGEADGGEEEGHGVVGEVVNSVMWGAAMHGRQQQSVQEGSDVPVVRPITLTLRQDNGASSIAATGATPPTPSAVAAAVVPAVARMQEEQRLQWAALVVVYALVAVCLALILRLQFRRGAFGIAIATVAAAAATTGGVSATRPHQLCSHSPYGTCSCPVAKRAVDRCQV
ncbi:unnamed protein product [Closterium sp. Naga37s-1]|nr:unnamed protein product [Closterium sp. Naga37s-1]